MAAAITQVLTKSIIHAPADAVWRVIGDFGAACRYLAMMVDCKAVGARAGRCARCPTLTGAPSSSAWKLDEASYRLSYALLTDTPFRDCLTTVTVHDQGRGRCEVTWAAAFDVDGLPASEAQEMLEGAFELNGRALQHFLATQGAVTDCNRPRSQRSIPS